ncbi:MAG: hypothetical protein AB1921_01680 [Thermodesulfobacteriota bacterium]
MTVACADYRKEMMLAGLRRRLQNSDLADRERRELTAEIAKLEIDLGLRDAPIDAPEEAR